MMPAQYNARRAGRTIPVGTCQYDRGMAFRPNAGGRPFRCFTATQIDRERVLGGDQPDALTARQA